MGGQLVAPRKVPPRVRRTLSRSMPSKWHGQFFWRSLVLTL